MLLVIASDMMNQLSIPGLMECIASDMLSLVAESRDMQQTFVTRDFYATVNIAQ